MRFCTGVSLLTNNASLVFKLSADDMRCINEICVQNPGKRHRFVNFDQLWGTSQFADDR